MGGGGFDVADPAAEIIGEWMRAQHALQVGVAAGGLFALFGREGWILRLAAQPT